MGRALCVLGEFEPYGRRCEAGGESPGGNESYLLFDPGVARPRGATVEQAVMASCCSHHEEEIYIRGNVVVWSAGNHVRKRFSAPSPVLQACWCSMESVMEPLLCVLHSNSLSAYAPSGEVNSVPFPCSMSSMWSLPSGLILKRALDNHSSSAFNPVLPVSSSILKLPKSKFTSSLRRASMSPAPENSSSVYYTLHHPLEEPEALHIEDSGRMSPMTDAAEHLLWSSTKAPYVVSYSKDRNLHTLWEVKTLRQSGRKKSMSVCLSQLWEETGAQSQASQVFMATDADDDLEPLVCIVVKDAKKLFTLKISKDPEVPVNIAWTISALSAVPIVASRPKSSTHFDLLVLAPDGNMYLYAGRYPLCTFFLPSLPIHQQVSTSQEQAEELSDAVESNLNVLTSSGKVYRCSVDLIPSSGLTNSCLSALAEGLRPSFYRYIFSSFIDSYSSKSGDLSRLDTGPDKEWAAFTGIISQFIEKPRETSLQQPPLTSWEFLLQSTKHKHSRLLYPCFRFKGKEKLVDNTPVSDDQKKTGYSSMLLEILEILHLVYEDYKLDISRWRELWRLALLLNNVAVAVEQYNYADYYTTDFPALVQAWPELSKFKAPNVSVPNHFGWIEGLLRRRRGISSLPAVLTNTGNSSMNWSRKVLGFYELLFPSGYLSASGSSRSSDGKLPSGITLRIAGGTAKTPEQRVVLAMAGENFCLSQLDRLPCGVSLPLRHAMNNCRESPPTDWPSDAYILLGREDLAYMSASRSSCLRNGGDILMAAPYMLHLRPTLPVSEREASGPEARLSGSVDGQVSDGMEHMFTPASSLRFGSDLRLNEVRRTLCSSKHVAVRTANTPDVSDPDLVAQQQAQLWQLAQRSTALPFGRGAFTLSTLRPMLTEALPIPKLVLAGRLPSQHDAIVNLDVNAGNINELTSWPEFHNGVAAGLRLAPGQAKITRTWIVYNKPDEPSYEHAGFLMALGLHKHLAVLAATDVFRYLSQEHDPTTVGILLGMAAAHRGNMDPAMSKMLYLHIPARHPPSFPELELSSLLQSAALMAVGLLYQGSAHRLTTEILLAEIGRKPGSDSSLDREGYALAAGLALGLVTLGRGNDAWGLSDLMIEDRLRHYMCGGSEPSDEHRRRFDGASNFLLVPKAYEDQSQTGGQVLEGSIVNLDVTAPGATLALALMFLKTNNHAVAARLAIPETHFALEYVRPDFILLRLVARSLILWDSVQASEEWLQSQVPDIVRQAISVDEDAEAPPDSDVEALAQAHVNILAGACLSIGLRFAGTADSDAQRLLYHYALFFMKEKSTTASAPSPRRVDRGTLETCLCVAVLSLSVVMAGTGHLETFKLLRFLRRRNDSDIVYGNHMAISMAIGFLFLGGGSLTFSTNDAAIAALLISLYPRFPTSPGDHRCHLQAFRHLYVLASEARCVQAMDVDTGLEVYAPLQMTIGETNLHSETSYCRVSPCILPERSALKRVRVCGPRYWPQDIQITKPESKPWWEPGEQGDPFNSGVLYVKRKVGAQSYADDPIGSRSLLSRVLQRVSQMKADDDVNARDQSKVDELVGTFSSDPSLLAFAQLFCSGNSRDEFQDFCFLALFECVSMDKPALLQIYIELYTSVEGLIKRYAGHGSSINSLFQISLSLQNLKVALAYCEAAGHDSTAALKGESLIQRTFLASLAKRIDEVLIYWIYRGLERGGDDSQEQEQASEPPTEMITYLSSHTWPQSSDESSPLKVMFACYKCWDSFPQPEAVVLAVEEMKKTMPDWENRDETNLLPLLTSLLPGTPIRTLLQLGRCLPLIDWS